MLYASHIYSTTSNNTSLLVTPTDLPWKTVFFTTSSFKMICLHLKILVFFSW